MWEFFGGLGAASYAVLASLLTKQGPLKPPKRSSLAELQAKHRLRPTITRANAPQRSDEMATVEHQSTTASTGDSWHDAFVTLPNDPPVDSVRKENRVMFNAGDATIDYSNVAQTDDEVLVGLAKAFAPDEIKERSGFEYVPAPQVRLRLMELLGPNYDLLVMRSSFDVIEGKPTEFMHVRLVVTLPESGKTITRDGVARAPYIISNSTGNLVNPAWRPASAKSYALREAAKELGIAAYLAMEDQFEDRFSDPNTEVASGRSKRQQNGRATHNDRRRNRRNNGQAYKKEIDIEGWEVVIEEAFGVIHGSKGDFSKAHGIARRNDTDVPVALLAWSNLADQFDQAIGEGLVLTVYGKGRLYPKDHKYGDRLQIMVDDWDVHQTAEPAGHFNDPFHGSGTDDDLPWNN